MPPLKKKKTALWTGMVLCVAAAVAAFLPLLRAIGYEFHVLLATLLVFSLPLWVPRPAGTALLRLMSRSVLFAAALFGMGAIVGLMRGGLCNSSESFSYFLRIPLSSAVLFAWFYHNLCVLFNSLWPTKARPSAVWAYYGVLLMSVALGLWHLYSEPRIVEYNAILGYFAGSIYDESIDVMRGLLWYRLYHAMGVGAFALLAHAIAHRRERMERMRAALYATTLVGLMAGLFWLHGVLPKEGVQVKRADIQQYLDGVVESAHFRIYYRADAADEEWVRYLVYAHERAYAELTAFFGFAHASLPIESYIYPDAKTKGRLMGGARTSVSKVWLNEMHMSGLAPGSSLVKHELAHIFASNFGVGPLRLSGGIIPHMGWVEGIAVAAEWPLNEGDPHRWAREILHWDVQYSIDSLISAAAFWSQPSRKAYITMGSWVRYIHDTYGVDAMIALSNGADPLRVVGKTRGDLEMEWKAYLQRSMRDDARLRALSLAYFDRHTIFQRRCAREISLRVDRLWAALEGEEASQCEALFRELYEDAREDEGLYQMLVWAQLYRPELAHDPVDTARLEPALRADFLWANKGDIVSAQRHYMALLLELAQSDAVLRSTVIKLQGILEPAAEAYVKSYFFTLRNEEETLAFLEDWVKRSPAPVAHYLLALAYDRKAHFAKARKHWRLAFSHGELPKVLQYHAHWRWWDSYGYGDAWTWETAYLTLILLAEGQGHRLSILTAKTHERLR